MNLILELGGEEKRVPRSVFFSAEIGVTLLEPSTQLSGIVNVLGTINLTQAELDTWLQGAQDDVDKELDEFEIWPVLSIGLNYAF